jgi:hypothetical protein
MCVDVGIEVTCPGFPKIGRSSYGKQARGILYTPDHSGAPLEPALNPVHFSTGSFGYFGYAGSVLERPQSQNMPPLPVRIRAEWKQWMQSPTLASFDSSSFCFKFICSLKSALTDELRQFEPSQSSPPTRRVKSPSFENKEKGWG